MSANATVRGYSELLIRMRVYTKEATPAAYYPNVCVCCCKVGRRQPPRGTLSTRVATGSKVPKMTGRTRKKSWNLGILEGKIRPSG